MAMTPQEKIDILQKMRGLVETRNYGFCRAYAQVRFGDAEEYLSVTETVLNELGLFKPSTTFSCNNWYSMWDVKTRLTKIDEAISKHQSEINNMNNNEIQREIETRRKNIEAETAKLKELEGRLKEEYFDLSDFKDYRKGDVQIGASDCYCMDYGAPKYGGLLLNGHGVKWTLHEIGTGSYVLIPTRK